MNRTLTLEAKLADNFQRVLGRDGLHPALQLLNSTTPYRLTGVYRFEAGLVKNVALFDRIAPNLRQGADVPWFDSYCMMTAKSGDTCEITNALLDPRLMQHAARARVLSYCAVLLKTPTGEGLGTLCHYDFFPRDTPDGILEGLRACRCAVERYLWSLLGYENPNV